MSMVSEEFLNSLRVLVRNEFRNEVREGTTIVTDCLVCATKPSLDCLICNRKYGTAAKSKPKDTADQQHPPKFSEYQQRKSRVSSGGTGPTGTISSGTSNSSQYATTGANTNKRPNSDVGALNEHILSLRHQIQAHEVKRELLQESLDDASKNVFYWKQQYQQLQQQLIEKDEATKKLESIIDDMENQIKALKHENSLLLDRARVSEACRSNAARTIAHMRSASSALFS